MSKEAEDGLGDLDDDLRERVKTRLRKLGEQPRGGPNTTALKDDRGFRVRVGPIRALYFVRDDLAEVRVTRVLRRNEKTYK